MTNTNNYQDTILNELLQNKIPFTMFLMNGFQMRGTLVAFDNFVLVVEDDGRQQLVYKHAISTLIPHYMFDAVVRQSTEQEGTR